MTKRQKHTIEMFPEFMHCKECNHMASEHESFEKIYGHNSLPQVIYWNCKNCICRKFIE